MNLKVYLLPCIVPLTSPEVLRILYQMAKRVLIVEDNEAIAENLFDFLEMASFEPCGIAKSYNEAIQKLSECNPDLAILDVNLQGELSGVDVANFIRENAQIPFIYFSAVLEPELLRRAMSTKPFAFLSKPNEFANLKAAIDSALEKKLPPDIREVSVIDKAVEFIAPGFMVSNLMPKV